MFWSMETVSMPYHIVSIIQAPHTDAFNASVDFIFSIKHAVVFLTDVSTWSQTAIDALHA